MTRLLAFLFWLRSLRRRVDKHQRCPACGWKLGRIRFAQLKAQDQQEGEHMIEHTCSVCGAVWAEPVLQPEVWRRA